MITVKIGHKDSDQRNIIKALQKLKQIVSREGTLNDVKKKRYFTKYWKILLEDNLISRA